MKTLIISFVLLISVAFSAQEKLYHPEADAKADIQNAIELAQKENKNIILQVGGNWCSWCILFNKYIHKDEEVNQLVEENYIYYHLNYSKENKNQDILDSYKNPETKGFPVLLVLNSMGELIATQETGSLEEGKGYNKEKVMAFFQKYIPLEIH